MFVTKAVDASLGSFRTPNRSGELMRSQTALVPAYRNFLGETDPGLSVLKYELAHKSQSRPIPRNWPRRGVLWWRFEAGGVPILCQEIEYRRRPDVVHFYGPHCSG